MGAALTLEEVEAAGGYSIIYADPPWLYQADRNSRHGRLAAPYSVMTHEAICALPVARLAAADACLFMWGTWPKLLECQEVMRAWGFEYKTCGFVWVKYHEGSGKRCVGGGSWTRANTEFCLIGVRGKEYPRRLETRGARGVRQLIETWPGDGEVLLAPRGEHSAKPPEARERIVAMLGDLPRIELFARDRAEGWDAWGDDPALGGADVSLCTCRGATNYNCVDHGGL